MKVVTFPWRVSDHVPSQTGLQAAANGESNIYALLTEIQLILHVFKTTFEVLN